MLHTDQWHNQCISLEQKLVTVIHTHGHKSRTFLIGITQTLLLKIPNDCHVLQSHHCYFIPTHFKGEEEKKNRRSFVEWREPYTQLYLKYTS